MKNIFLLLLLCPGMVGFSQISIEHTNNPCPEEDILSVCIGDAYPFLGKYRYVTRDMSCPNEPNVILSGETEFLLNFRSNYRVEDWSFGMWAYCYDLEGGTDGTIEMIANCGKVDTIQGTDRFGDLWSADNFMYTDSSISFRWFNTFGEFGTTELIPLDGQNITNPETVFESDYSFLWSTGETTQTISTRETGLIRVTVTDPEGQSFITKINIEPDLNVLGEECTSQILKTKFFLDNNQDGLFNENDFYLRNNFNLLTISPTPELHGFRGEYEESYIIEPGLYDLSLNNSRFKSTNMPSELEILPDSGTNEYEFGVFATEEISEADISISTGTFERCNRIIPYQLRIKNTGTTALNETVELRFSEGIKYIDADIKPKEEYEGYLAWSVSIPEPSYELAINILFELPDVELIGEILCLEPSIAGDTKSLTAHCFELVCAYDPNDKFGVPFRGNENPIYPGEAIDYTIRFENLGNDTAFTVRVEDQLDNNFDLSTLQFIQSSHEIKEYFITDEGFVRFFFENIELPAPSEDNDDNTGFVQFRIAPKTTAVVSTIYHNDASIFFDFNPAIITNQTWHILEMPSALNDFAESESIYVSPNPTNGDLKITTSDSEIEFKKITVYNIRGEKLGQYSKTSLNLNYLNAGVYFVMVETNKGVVRRKFVKL